MLGEKERKTFFLLVSYGLVKMSNIKIVNDEDGM